MIIGMLWFDDDPKRPVEKKIQRAAARYMEKYGVAPNLCYANPRTLNNREPFKVKLPAGKNAFRFEKVTVKPARSILLNHFWLGVAES